MLNISSIYATGHSQVDFNTALWISFLTLSFFPISMAVYNQCCYRSVLNLPYPEQNDTHHMESDFTHSVHTDHAEVDDIDTDRIDHERIVHL